jgi:hypothetical protein
MPSRLRMRTQADVARSAVVATLIVLCFSSLGACGGDNNSLTGSIGESFSLVFDRVQIIKQGSALRIEYVKDASLDTVTKVCKVVVDTEGLSLKGGSRIRGDTFLSRVLISRVARTGGDFPPVKSGAVEFRTYRFRDDGRIEGDFEAIFDNGRSLSGNFDATVHEVSLN